MTDGGELVGDLDTARVTVLASALIPSAHDMPAFGDLHDSDAWLLRAVKARPDLVPHLREALAAAGELPPDVALRRMAEGNREDFEALTTVIIGAYLMHPTVRDLLGYPGQVEVPLRDDLDDYLPMLERVYSRGEIYRQVPE